MVVALCVAIDVVFCDIFRLRRTRGPLPQPVPAEPLSPAVGQLLSNNGRCPPRPLSTPSSRWNEPDGCG